MLGVSSWGSNSSVENLRCYFASFSSSTEAIKCVHQFVLACSKSLYKVRGGVGGCTCKNYGFIESLSERLSNNNACVNWSASFTVEVKILSLLPLYSHWSLPACVVGYCVRIRKEHIVTGVRRGLICREGNWNFWKGNLYYHSVRATVFFATWRIH